MVLFRIAIISILICYGACEERKCVTAKKCGECIGQSIDCVWCDDANHTGSRCQMTSSSDASWCLGKVHNPHEEPIKIVRDAPIRANEPVVQLRPQALNITVRRGQTTNFTFTYKPAKDYPLDIYYLMDFSFTMKKTINLLKDQATIIYDELNVYTNNVRLGLGSFVEKGALPFATPGLAYAFKHRLNLTTDKGSFRRKLARIDDGTNFDDPESGLDALMQVMVCKDEVGWRNHSRKIIVLCTDSTYHSAGDGKIAGAAKLNDMKCHLTADGIYSLELEQDYPSVNQIRKIAEEKSIIVIFNVREHAKRDYVNLINTIESGAEYVELKEDSDIVKIITDIYTKKLNQLHMTVSTPDYIRVKLTPDCTNPETCEVEHHGSIDVSVSITVDDTADNEACLNKKITVVIKPVELDETMKINVETICECKCENTPTPNAVECSGNGTLECGICKCNPNHYGEKCNCDGTSTMTNMNECKKNTADLVTCSGHGACSCGQCSCYPDYSGDYCEYHDKSCPKDQESGLMCADNGKCYRGRCNCRPGWTGHDCHCPISQDTCRAPYSSKLCSGNGDCDCGRCLCTNVDSKNNTYFGDFCENCYDCDDIRCRELEDYVKCVYRTTKAECDEKYNSKKTVVSMVNKTEINSPKYHLAKRCQVLWNENKIIVFKHKYDRRNRELHIIIQKELEEPDRANMWIAIGSAIGGILLIGLLSVIAWKILVDIYDKREYDRFNKLLDEAGDMENINVIYKAPTVTFSNPLFNRKSRMYN